MVRKKKYQEGIVEARNEIEEDPVLAPVFRNENVELDYELDSMPYREEEMKEATIA